MIVSAQNRLVKKAAALKNRKNRDSTGLFIIEGEKFVNELPDDWEVECFIISKEFSGSLKRYEQRAVTEIVSDEIFRHISDTVTPQGVLAVVKRKEYSLDILRGVKHPFVLLCEDIQDPGNLGTLLRTADAVGCDCVILSKGSVDVYNPKVLRATAGSVFHVPVIERAVLPEIIGQLHRQNISVIAARPGGGVLAHEADFTVACAILIGNEGRGLSEEALALAETHVSIPMPGRAESLNASVAGGILMYETVRQRLILSRKDENL